MGRHIVALLLISLSLTTCMHNMRAPSPTHSYNVYIHDGFSESQKESIVKGYTEWTEATDGLITFNQVSRPDHSLSMIDILPVNQDEMNALHGDKIGWASYHGTDTNILIRTELNHRDFYQTVIHEVGHALGLDHEFNLHYSYKSTMMEHTMDSIARVTCHDLISFCKEWNCNAYEFRRCKEARSWDLE